MTQKNTIRTKSSAIQAVTIRYDQWSAAGYETIAHVLFASGEKQDMIVDEVLTDGFFGRPVSIVSSANNGIRKAQPSSHKRIVLWKNLDSITLEPLDETQEFLQYR